MCRLIESICLKDNKIRNLELHQDRVSRSQKELFNSDGVIKLEHVLRKMTLPESGKYKIRILYSRRIESIDIIPYQARKIKSFTLIRNNGINYSLKLEDRSVFTEMKTVCSANEIIILKNDAVTDTSFSNLIFYDGKKWVTPDTFLLNGTMRQFLLSEGKITAKKIGINELKEFQSFRLVNALLNMDEGENYDISTIKW